MNDTSTLQEFTLTSTSTYGTILDKVPKVDSKEV